MSFTDAYVPTNSDVSYGLATLLATGFSSEDKKEIRFNLQEAFQALVNERGLPSTPERFFSELIKNILILEVLSDSGYLIIEDLGVRENGLIGTDLEEIQCFLDLSMITFELPYTYSALEPIVEPTPLPPEPTPVMTVEPVPEPPVIPEPTPIILD